MTKIILAVLNSRLKIPKVFINLILTLFNQVYRIFKFNALWSREEKKRLSKIITSTYSSEKPPPRDFSWGSITINIVATDKDLELLNQVVRFSCGALPNFEINLIRIIVPGNQKSRFLEETKQLRLQTQIHVIDEELIVPYEYGRDIFQNKFPERRNWCYQQFLKVASVLSSKTEFALVVDCDTLLLNPRKWLTEEGLTCVMPTFEYESQYENLLQALGVKDIYAEWSFVPHHMLYKVDYLKRIIEKLGMRNLDHLARKVEELSDDRHSSPFCIDYSLYGHSIHSAHGTKTFIRWSNLEVPRRFAPLFKTGSAITRMTSMLFNSISFHSWQDR